MITVSETPVEIAELDARFQKAEVTAYVVVTAPNGVWGRANKSGSSAADAFARALAACKAGNGEQNRMLYALNNTVELEVPNETVGRHQWCAKPDPRFERQVQAGNRATTFRVFVRCNRSCG